MTEPEEAAKPPAPRTLMEIVESAKDGQKPSHDDCYWAMLALDYLLTYANQDLRKSIGHLVVPNGKVPNDLTLKIRLNENFERNKLALGVNPKAWLGPTNDPANPERQRERASNKKIFDHVSEKLGWHTPGNTGG